MSVWFVKHYWAYFHYSWCDCLFKMANDHIVSEGHYDVLHYIFVLHLGFDGSEIRLFNWSSLERSIQMYLFMKVEHHVS